MSFLRPWKARLVHRLDAISVGALTLKAYGITRPNPSRLDEESMAAAHGLIQSARSEIEATAHDGAGFIILHHGEQGVWLLLHWWIYGDICAQKLWRAAMEAKSEFHPVERPLMACVWELALIDHERRAWTRTMLALNPSLEAYLVDLYPEPYC